MKLWILPLLLLGEPVATEVATNATSGSPDPSGALVEPSELSGRAATTPEPMRDQERYELLAFCWHDVVDESVGELDQDPYSVSTHDLLQQFEWLAAHGYRTVTIDDVLAANAGERALPPRAMLLTFDDGLMSVRERVLPLLELYDFSAVVSVVGTWTEAAGQGPSAYLGDGSRARRYAGWDDLRELVDSGRIEIASHSYAGHAYIPADPQGNLRPSYVTRRFDGSRGLRETDEVYLARVRDDMQRNLDLIEERLGIRPRVMTWPFGRSNGSIEALASELGIAVTLGLRKEAASVRELASLPRLSPRDLPSLVWQLHLPDPRPPVRSVTLELEDLDDENPFARSRKLERAVIDVAGLGIERVVLKAFADDETGLARAAYFPSDRLPVRRDLLNHVAHRLREEAGVEVYAWLPVRGVSTASADPFCLVDPDHLYVSLVEDLARSSNIDGLLLHDVGEVHEGDPILDRMARRARELGDATLRVVTTLDARWVLDASEGALASIMQSRRERFDETLVVFESPLPRASEPWDVARRLVPYQVRGRVGAPGLRHRTVVLLPTDVEQSAKSATRALA